MNVLTNTNRNNTTKKREILSGKKNVPLDVQNRISLSDFNFLTVQDILKDCDNSLTDELIEERRSN